MKGSWQIFVAPGEENESLPLDKSPWHEERWVFIPQEHWDLILDFADKVDMDKAEELKLFSYTSDNNKDYIHAPAQKLEILISFIENLEDRITNASPLIQEPTEEIPNAFVNEEHVRMLKAVSAVFKESLRLEMPFRAWVE